MNGRIEGSIAKNLIVSVAIFGADCAARLSSLVGDFLRRSSRQDIQQLRGLVIKAETDFNRIIVA